MSRVIVAVLCLNLFGHLTTATAAPFENGKFIGRIAWSCDGNHNDPDDWAASPVALAIFSEAGLKDRLVHFDYNCILPQTNAEWEQIHATSVLGTAERYGYNLALFHDCRKNLDATIASIARAIDESSAENPLYFVVAGPMEVPVLGIQKSNPDKHKFVYCISHSRWNDGFASKYTFTHTKRSVIATGINWVQIRDQNKLLSTSPYGMPATKDEYWLPWHWMRDSRDDKARWLWTRMQVSTRPDPSDAGMAYFLVTGDEDADPEKLRQLLDTHQVPQPIATRSAIRLEAENFATLDNFQVEERNARQASHRLDVQKADEGTARILTRFQEPYAKSNGKYDVEIRYFDGKAAVQVELKVNGISQGKAQQTPGQSKGWQTLTWRDVPVALGDTIEVNVTGSETWLDYVQLNQR